MDEIVLNQNRSDKTSRQDDPEPLPALHQRATGPTSVFEQADSKSATLAAFVYALVPSAGSGEQPPRRPKVPLCPTIFT
jgi:hypothetical protein